MTIYAELSYNNQKVEIQQIEGIQFSVLGPEEIIKRSVVEVNRTDTYAGSEPIVGGLFDSRMGILEHNKICSTCEQKNIFCPGHFGHITLARPVFHAMFFDITKKILKCVCYRCSRILVSPHTQNKDFKNDISKIVSIKNNQKRWDAYFKLCNTSTKIKKCGDDDVFGCNTRQPTRYNKDGSMKIIAEWKDKSTKEENKTIQQEFTPEDVLRIFKRITDEDMMILGFNPKWNRPEWLICTVLPVPPPAVRPSIVEENGQRREDDLTHKLSDIIKTNNNILDKIKKGASEETIKLISMVLQYHVFTFIDNQIPGLAPSQQRNGRKLKSVGDRMKKKEGRIRGNLNGKRVDQSARSVITPDPYISIDELGVPVKIALNITFPEIVNKYNIEELRKLIKNGPDVYPGAKYVKKSFDNFTINLKYANLDKISKELKYDDVVHRHLTDGDYILFNRQPSLHKMSMMCHKVIIMPYQTFRLNVLDTPPYNADFDGDEMNLHCPQNIQTMNELKDIASVPYLIIAPRDGKPIIEIVQDTLLGSYRLTKDYTTIGDKQMANLQMVNSYFKGSLKKSKNFTYTGREAYSQILPPSLFIKTRDDKDGKINFMIDNSELKIGSLGKSIFHRISKGLIPIIYHDYGPIEAKRFLDNTQRLICRWLLTAGFSVGISDLVTDVETDKNLKNKIKEMKSLAYSKLDEIRRGVLDNNSIFNNEEFIERELINILNKTTSEVAKIGLSQIDEKNNRMINMVKSGSKGKETNVAQMIACVGQQNVDGKRIAYGFTDRTLPHYTKYDDGPEARGFVENSFISGLSPQEVFFHAMGGREGLIDTAVKSITGDSKIIIIEDNKPKCVNIGDWIDNKLNNELNKNKIELSGPEELNLELLNLDIDNEVYITTGDNDGKTSWGKVTAITRHDVGNVLYKIITKHGRSVIVPNSKTLLVWNNLKYEFEPIKTDEVKIGDLLPSLHNIEKPPTTIEYINMIDYYTPYKYLYGSEIYKAIFLYLNELTSKNRRHVNNEWYEQNNGNNFILPFENIDIFERNIMSSKFKIENIEKNNIYNINENKIINSYLPDKFLLNEENGLFIGIYMALGNINKEDDILSFNIKDNNIIEFIKSIYDKYNIKYKIKNRDIIITKGTNNLLFEFIKDFIGVDVNDVNDNIKIMEYAYMAPNEFIKGLLNGYISSLGVYNNNGIEVNITNNNLLNGLNTLCNRMGIYCNISNNKLVIDKQFINILITKIKLINDELYNVLLLNTLNNIELYKTYNDITFDEIESIIILSGDEFKKYNKLYDITVPSTLNFTLFNGLNIRDTSETGYIQRRLVKAMEDSKIYYDNTVRTATGSIVQYIYGEDGMDGSKIETQYIPIIDKDIIILDQEYHLRESDKLDIFIIKEQLKTITNNTYKRCTKHFEEILEDKRFLIEYIYNNDKNNIINYPIPFQRIIKTAIKRRESAGINAVLSDLTPDYIFDKIDKIKDELYIKDKEQGTRFFNILLRLYLSPKKLIIEQHINKDIFDWILSQITDYYKKAIAQPGEMVGIVAAQTIGEIGTQMTLDSFHVSGTAAAVKATSGVPRLKEILSATKKTKTPTLIIYMKQDIASVINPIINDTDNKENDDPRIEKTKSIAMNIKNSIEITKLADILESSEIYWDNTDFQSHIEDDAGIMEIYKAFSSIETSIKKCRSNSNWVLRMKFNKEKMNSYGLRMIDIYTKLNISYNRYIDCVYSDDNADECIFRIQLTDLALNDIDPSDEIAAIKAMEHNLVYQVLLKGYKGINKVSLNKKNYNRFNKDTQQFDKVIEWVLDTDGTNLLEILSNQNIDSTRTISNDIREIYEILGIEAARNALYSELMNVTSEGSMNYRHLSLLIDTMTYKGQLMSIDRHGINRGDIGPLAKSSFEETTDMLINASIFSEYDNMNGVSANVMTGQVPNIGTGDSHIVLDEEHFMELLKDVKEDINKGDVDNGDGDNGDEGNGYGDNGEICNEENISFNFTNPVIDKCYELKNQSIKII